MSLLNVSQSVEFVILAEKWPSSKAAVELRHSWPADMAAMHRLATQVRGWIIELTDAQPLNAIEPGKNKIASRFGSQRLTGFAYRVTSRVTSGDTG